MSLYRRILRFLEPHASVLVVAVAATFVFAALDAFGYVLLIPFVQALFVTPAPAAGGAGAGGMDRFLHATVYRFVDLQGDPLVPFLR